MDHSAHSQSSSLWHRRELVHQLVRRDVMGRYRSSFMGLVWSFVYPLLTLSVYTLVFGFLLRPSWLPTSNPLDLARFLFVGLIVFNFFAECVSRAPTLLLQYPGFIKKVRFPVEVLPWVVVGSALFHAAVAFVVWLGFSIVVGAELKWTVAIFPLVTLAVAPLALGLCFLFCAVGVFVRDLAHIAVLAVQALVFLSPVFYTVGAVSESWRWLLWVSPLTVPIESARAVLLDGPVPGAWHLLLYVVVGALVLGVGVRLFKRLRPEFADVV